MAELGKATACSTAYEASQGYNDISLVAAPSTTEFLAVACILTISN